MKTLLKVVYLMLASFCSYTINAQTKYPSIINLSGDSKQIEGIIWDWSFGEQLLVQTLYSNKNLILTTGYLQNDFGNGVNFKILETTTPFKIGPNPFMQNLKIHSDQSGMIISKIEIPIVLLGGKMDIRKSNTLIRTHPDKKIINACGKYSLIESAAIMEKSKMVLTGDTGLMHIAACFDIPIFVIWGNTTPYFGMSPYKPEGNSSVHNFELQNLSCRPCSKIGYHECPKGHFKCMELQDALLISQQINKGI